MRFKLINQKRWFMLFITMLLLVGVGGTSLAFAKPKIKELTIDQLNVILKDHPTTIPVTATTEVLFEINRIRSNDDLKQYIKECLARMEKYKPMIVPELKKKSLPEDLLAVPLALSGYQMLTSERNLQQTSGLWQMPPSIAKQYGLTAEINRDDRLNPQTDTVAAVSYLNDLYKKFQDWNLALIAYKLGQNETIDLINKVGSKDPWVIVRSSKSPDKLRVFFPYMQAMILILNDPKIFD